MPQRDNELPEGTDHIINGAMETGGAGGGGGAATAGGASSGFVGAAGSDDTGGTAAGDPAGGTSGGGVVGQLKTQASTLRGQAGGRVREFAETGKTRASGALDELSKVVSDAADSVDERLGAEYGDYARRASDAVAGLADTLRRKEVDEIYEDVRNAVRKSPAVAVGIAAVVGFTLVRLVKAGLADEDEDGRGKSGGA
jgi:hypothetical protein